MKTWRGLKVRVFSWKYQPSGAGGTRSPPAAPHRLQRRTACKIQNGRQGAPKWQRGSGKVSTPRFVGVLSNFCKISFSIRALLLWIKVATEGGRGGGNGEKREKTDENSVHYVTASSLPPERGLLEAARSCKNNEPTLLKLSVRLNHMCTKG